MGNSVFNKFCMFQEACEPFNFTVQKVIPKKSAMDIHTIVFNTTSPLQFLDSKLNLELYEPKTYLWPSYHF